MKNAAALHQARKIAVQSLFNFAAVAFDVRRERPADAAQLVAAARAHALDALATFGACLALAHVDLGPLPRIAEDLALGLLSGQEIDQAAATVRELPLPHHVEAA